MDWNRVMSHILHHLFMMEGAQDDQSSKSLKINCYFLKVDFHGCQHFIYSLYDSLFIFLITENGFTQHDMAVMLGVSKRTVENRMAEFNLTNQNRFSDIDDSSLDAHTERIIGIFPRSGTVSSPLHNCIKVVKMTKSSILISCNNLALFTSGLKTIEGELVSQGVRVQRRRLRESVKRVDPVGRRLQRINVIRRRVYSVHSPLSLWHMDGNHKLIR